VYGQRVESLSEDDYYLSLPEKTFHQRAEREAMKSESRIRINRSQLNSQGRSYFLFDLPGSLRTGMLGTCLCLILFPFSGCSDRSRENPPPPAQNTAPTEPEPLIHQVSYSGETLALIASWYTGKSTNWTLIRDANPGIRPQRINLGQRIVIPGNLVSERSPMPKKFVQDSIAKLRQSPRNDESEADDREGAEKEAVPSPDSGTTEPPKQPVDEENIDINELIGKDQVEENKQNPPAVPAVTPAPSVENTGPAENTGSVGTEERPAKTPTPGDAERDKLLDELLAQ
jgi:hypothetical protein